MEVNVLVFAEVDLAQTFVNCVDWAWRVTQRDMASVPGTPQVRGVDAFEVRDMLV